MAKERPKTSRWPSSELPDDPALLAELRDSLRQVPLMAILRDDAYPALNLALAPMLGYDGPSELVGRSWRAIQDDKEVHLEAVADPGALVRRFEELYGATVTLERAPAAASPSACPGSRESAARRKRAPRANRISRNEEEGKGDIPAGR